MDQAGLFLPADDFHLDAGGLQDAINQDFLVGCLTHGAGRYRPNLADAVIMHDFLKCGKSIYGFLDAGFANNAILECIFPQPDGNAQAFQWFQMEVLIHLTNHETDRIGTYVNRSNCLHGTHLIRLDLFHISP